MALNQYTKANEITLPVNAYDDDGNLTVAPLSKDQNTNVIYHWDAENRLVKITSLDQTVTIAKYSHDYLGRRISKETTVNTQLTTVHWIYDGWNPIAEYTGTALTKRYTWGMDLSGSMQGAGGVGGLLMVTEHGSSTSHYYPTYDGNGNVSEYLDSTGTAVAHYEYDAFGNEIVTATSGTKSADFAHKFSTKYQDSETALYYYGYRYYDPNNGRFINRDPIEEAGGMNLYAFVNNDAINKWDYLGMVALKLSYTTTQELELGECGSYKWKIKWNVSPKSSKFGGLVLQEMNVKAIETDPFGTQLRVLLDEKFWEAWRVMPDSKTVASPTGGAIDFWRSGGYEGTQGKATIKGWARYRDPIKLSILDSKMPKGSVRFTHGLWSSYTDPKFTSKKSGLVYRKLVVEWCCTIGATKEQRKTKVVEKFPK